MASSSVLSVSRDISPSHPPDPSTTTDNPSNDPNNTTATATMTSADTAPSGAFSPEKPGHLDPPNGGYYAGSRKDFPLPADRYPLPRASVKRLLEPEPGTKGGRQRSYLDDPTYPVQGYWTEAGEWVDWPPKGDGDGDEKKEEVKEEQAREDGAQSESQSQSQTRRSSDDHTASAANNNSSGSGNGNGNGNAKETDRVTASATVGTRRQANGTIGSVYSGNKIRHLKKDDGIPLWRKDIQYEFLKLVFEDKTPVFTRLSDGAKGLDFADIYIDAMAKSSKTSKILKDKLQNDKAAAISMAMVCLLVNFGRMNTTLNFFPEMRAQLRTYHSIPSLQAHQDPNAYKQLQDAPRLKSILKGASEDTDQPNTIDKIKQAPVPRTNPVHLIFVMAQYAPRVSELHFFPPRDFFDLVMRSSLSSKSRAKAFLWLMWYYLESDFSAKDALNNPFGAGLVGEGTDGLPLKVPAFEPLTEAEADAENVDTPEEIVYGEEKQRERKRILEEDDPGYRVGKRPKKSEWFLDYNTEELISELGAGERASMTGRHTPEYPQEEEYELPPRLPRVRGGRRSKRDSSTHGSVRTSQPRRIVLKTRMDQTPDTVSPAPPGSAHPVLNQFGTGTGTTGPTSSSSRAILPQQQVVSGSSSSRRPRPLTQHQLAVEQNRKQRVDYLLAQRRSAALKEIRARRQNEVPFVRAGRLLQNLTEDYDTDEEGSWGKGGLCPHPADSEDYGEAAGFYCSVLKRAARRLQRWDWDCMVDDERRRVEAKANAAAAAAAAAAAGGEEGMNLGSFNGGGGAAAPGNGNGNGFTFVNGTHDPAQADVTPVAPRTSRAKPRSRRKPRVAEVGEDGEVQVPVRKPRGRAAVAARNRQAAAAAAAAAAGGGDGGDSAAGVIGAATGGAVPARKPRRPRGSGVAAAAAAVKAEEGGDAAAVPERLGVPEASAADAGAEAGAPSFEDDVSHVEGEAADDKESLVAEQEEQEGREGRAQRKRKRREYDVDGEEEVEAEAEDIEGEDAEGAEAEMESDAVPPSSPSRQLPAAPPSSSAMAPPPMAKPRYSSAVMEEYRDSEGEMEGEGESYLGDSMISAGGVGEGDETDEVEEHDEDEEGEEEDDVDVDEDGESSEMEGEGEGEGDGEGDGGQLEEDEEGEGEGEGDGEGDGDEVMADA
ncbi:hypothetical protein AJ79_02279 [Helicocarpus griseus UAMH5409]|uniref:INO80 chromatin remodeling complex Ies1 n=1 Tax=Helicocarpus griseus UAMH5409 TaxID=1447875 RepID=A0A2B7Y3A5_9EURO|nr:hypothetical protein AJ79_02279 [Helicocarpus griseus UAMH5409]